MTNRFYGDTSKIDMAFQCREDEAEYHQRVFEGKSVCLVANGESVLKKNYGPLVDMHDVVVRMNAFQINGFERHVGARLDVHAATSFRFQHSEECEQAGFDYCSDGFLDRKAIKGGALGVTLTLYDMADLFLFWSRPAGLWETYLGDAWPTTGFRILLDARNAGAKSITLLGYDFFENSRYYFDPLKPNDTDRLVNPVHNPAREKEYIEFLVRNDERILKL